MPDDAKPYVGELLQIINGTPNFKKISCPLGVTYSLKTTIIKSNESLKNKFRDAERTIIIIKLIETESIDHSMNAAL